MLSSNRLTRDSLFSPSRLLLKQACKVWFIAMSPLQLSGHWVFVPTRMDFVVKLLMLQKEKFSKRKIGKKLQSKTDHCNTNFMKYLNLQIHHWGVSTILYKNQAISPELRCVTSTLILSEEKSAGGSLPHLRKRYATSTSFVMGMIN